MHILALSVDSICSYQATVSLALQQRESANSAGLGRAHAAAWHGCRYAGPGVVLCCCGSLHTLVSAIQCSALHIRLASDMYLLACLSACCFTVKHGWCRLCVVVVWHCPYSTLAVLCQVAWNVTLMVAVRLSFTFASMTVYHVCMPICVPVSLFGVWHCLSFEVAQVASSLLLGAPPLSALLFVLYCGGTIRVAVRVSAQSALVLHALNLLCRTENTAGMAPRL